MFSKETYAGRRAQLKQLVGEGLILLFGNNEAPKNYPANAYFPFRQDSSFIYYFGQKRDGLVGVIDIDNDREMLVGDDIDIEDIVWYGSVDCVSDLASQVGVANSAPMKYLRQPSQPTAPSISCLHTATTQRYSSWICSAFIPMSRKRALPCPSYAPWWKCAPPRSRRR